MACRTRSAAGPSAAGATSKTEGTTQWIPHLRSSPIFLDLGGQPWVYRAAFCLRCSNM